MYAKINNGIIIYPYTSQQLFQDNPSTSFTKNLTKEELIPFNVVIVSPTERPVVEYTQNIKEVDPKFEDGIWKQSWVVVPATEQEIVDKINLLSSSLRNKRNQLLQESDWTQSRDMPEEFSQTWAPYRQALRDITNQPGFPFEVTWPTKPE